MKKLISLAAIALAVCVAFVSCTKEEEGGTVTVNGETYTNVTATVNTEHGGLWFQFILDKDKGITASALVDARLALEKPLRIGAEENNGGWGDWILLSVEYGNGKVFGVQPGSATQTIKKVKDAYTVKVDGKDQNGKPYKIDVTAKVVE